LIRFDRFDILDDDEIQIFGSDDPNRILYRFFGSDRPETLVLDDSLATIKFLSDSLPAGVLRRGGWTISYLSSRQQPQLRLDNYILDFEKIAFGSSSKILPVRITANNLLNNLVVTPPQGFRVSALASGPFTDKLLIHVPRETPISTTVFVQFVPPSAGEFGGDLGFDAGSGAIFASVSGVAAPTIFWEPSNGPFSGRIQALGTALGNTLLAGTGSGVYRSNSNGAVWLQSNTGLNTKRSQNVHAIVSWQRNTCILTDAGLFRSQDSARTWARMPTTGLPQDAEVTSLLVIANTLFIGTDVGVYRFALENARWVSANKNLPADEEPYITTLAEHQGRIVAGLSATNDIAGVYMSLDTGRTWVSAGGAEPSRSLPLDDLHTVDKFASVGSRLYAILSTYNDEGEIEESNVYFTDNNGETWTADDGTGITDAGSLQFYDMKSVGTTLYLATYDGVFRRRNAGPPNTTNAPDTAQTNASWQQINRGISELTAQTLVTNGAAVYVGTYGRVFRSLNQGASWIPVNQGLTAALVYTMDRHRGVILAGTEGSGLFRSIDNGVTWLPANNGFPARYIGDILSSNTNLFACAYLDERNNGVYTSLDNGASWAKLSDFPTSNTNPRPLDPKPDVYALGKDSRGYLYAGGSIGSGTDLLSTFYYSTTNGVTWIDAPLPPSGQTSAVWALEDVPDVGMLAGTYGSGVFAAQINPVTRTVSWQKLVTSDGYEEAEYVRGFTTFQDFVYVATDGGLYYLNKNRMVLEPAQVDDEISERAILSITNTNGMLYIGTLGRGVWRSFDGDNWEQVQDGMINNADVFSLTSDGFNLFAGLSGNAIYRSSLQQPITAARVLLEIDDSFAAAPGDSVTITVRVASARNLRPPFPNVSGILRFNTTLLDPGENLRNEAVVNGERLLPFRVQLDSTRGRTILALRFRALLGNSVATPLTLTNLSANNVLVSSSRPGLFTLKNLSEAGGTRLFIAESKPLVAISPNPASALANVKVQTFEFGETILTISNTFGQTLKTFTTHDMEPGVYDFTALTNEMPQGIYFVTLQTPTHRVTRQLQVVR
jgi:ligand-binding sensor domain-containing protein